MKIRSSGNSSKAICQGTFWCCNIAYFHGIASWYE